MDRYLWELRYIEMMIRSLEGTMEVEMATLQDLQAQVAKNTEVEGSAVTLIEGLAAQLKAALAANDPAAIQALADSLSASATSLAAAVTANTPSA